MGVQRLQKEELKIPNLGIAVFTQGGGAGVAAGR